MSTFIQYLKKVFRSKKTSVVRFLTPEQQDDVDKIISKQLVPICEQAKTTLQNTQSISSQLASVSNRVDIAQQHIQDCENELLSTKVAIEESLTKHKQEVAQNMQSAFNQVASVSEKVDIAQQRMQDCENELLSTKVAIEESLTEHKQKVAQNMQSAFNQVASVSEKVDLAQQRIQDCENELLSTKVAIEESLTKHKQEVAQNMQSAFNQVASVSEKVDIAQQRMQDCENELLSTKVAIEESLTEHKQEAAQNMQSAFNQIASVSEKVDIAQQRMQDCEDKLHQFKTEIYNFVQNQIPIGCILCYPAEEIPNGWLSCDGSEYNKREYPLLYEVLKDTADCEGSCEETFCVPDLQGKFVRGWDADGNIDPEREIGDEQDDAFQGHAHEFIVQSEFTDSAGEHDHNVYFDNKSPGARALADDVSRIVSRTSTHDDFWPCSTNGKHQHQLPKMEIKWATSLNYGKINIANETRPKNVALIYCIKAL